MVSGGQWIAHGTVLSVRILVVLLERQDNNTEPDMAIGSDKILDFPKEYVNCCRDTVMRERPVCCFPNNKPWITSDIKDLINQKKQVFRLGDMMILKELQYKIKRSLKHAKLNCKRNIEGKLQNNDTREVWKGMRKI